MLDVRQNMTALPVCENVDIVNPELECCNADSATGDNDSHFIVNPVKVRYKNACESRREPRRIELSGNENAETDYSFAERVTGVTVEHTLDAKLKGGAVVSLYAEDAVTGSSKVSEHRMHTRAAASTASLAMKSAERSSNGSALATACRGSRRKAAAILLANALSSLRGHQADRSTPSDTHGTNDDVPDSHSVNNSRLSLANDSDASAAGCRQVSSVCIDSSGNVPFHPRVFEPAGVSEVAKPSVDCESRKSGNRCKVCGKLFQRKWGVRRHEMRFRGKCKMSNERCKPSNDTDSLPMKGKHYCQKCGRFFHSQYGVRRHEIRFRGNCKNSVLVAERWNFGGNSSVFGKHRCQLCGELFQRSYGLRRHQTRFHAFTGTRIKALQEGTTSSLASLTVEPELSQFNSAASTENKHCCQFCGKIYTRKWQLLRHETHWRGRCVNGATGSADDDAVVSSVSELETETDGDNRRCSLLDAKRNAQNFERSDDTGTSENSNEFDAQNHLRSSESAANGCTTAESNLALVGRGYKCRMCNKVYSSRSSYKRHLTVKRRKSAAVHCRDLPDVDSRDDGTTGSDAAVEDAENANSRVITSKLVERPCVADTLGCKGLRGSLRQAGLLVGVYRCFECDEGTEFATYELLIAHRRNYHRRSECHRCGLAFVGRLAFLEHARQVHPGIPVYKVNLTDIDAYSNVWNVNKSKHVNKQITHLAKICNIQLAADIRPAAAMIVTRLP